VLGNLCSSSLLSCVAHGDGLFHDTHSSKTWIWRQWSDGKEETRSITAGFWCQNLKVRETNQSHWTAVMEKPVSTEIQVIQVRESLNFSMAIPMCYVHNKKSPWFLSWAPRCRFSRLFPYATWASLEDFYTTFLYSFGWSKAEVAIFWKWLEPQSRIYFTCFNMLHNFPYSECP
jgi:hypothetical protein